MQVILIVAGLALMAPLTVIALACLAVSVRAGRRRGGGDRPGIGKESPLSRLVPSFTCYLTIRPGAALRVADNAGHSWDVDPAALAAAPGRTAILGTARNGVEATVESLWRTHEVGHSLRLRRPKAWRHAIVDAAATGGPAGGGFVSQCDSLSK